MREIESDGFITRDEDVSPSRDTCFNCAHYKYDISERYYRCFAGRSVGEEDWRQKYSVCDLWEEKERVDE